MEKPICPHCGKERPFSWYGGVGPCNCEVSKRASELAYERAKEKEACDDEERRQSVLKKDASCNHHWVGGINPVYCWCSKCGISISEYRRYVEQGR